MRQRYLIITAMAAMMVSCANNDTFKASVQADNENKPLSFAAYADKVTKSGNSTALNDFYNVFSVYGWKAVQKEDGSDTEYKPVFQNIPNEYFTVDDNGAVVYKTTGKPSLEWVLPADFGNTEGKRGYWYYEDVRYWDKMATSYQFFAIAPYDATPIYSVAPGSNNFAIATADEKYDITTEKNLALAGTPAVPQAALSYSGYNKDFMIADKVTANDVVTAANSDVQLTFHHILTKLNVKIKKDPTFNSKQQLIINELKITNLDKEGNYIYKGMTTNGWNTENKYNIDITDDYSLNADTNYDGCYWIENLIFPQKATKKATGAQPTAANLTDMYLYIQYQIGNEEFSAYYDFADIWDSTLGIGGEFEFKQGSQYDLTLTVGPKPIHFEALVSAWATENAGSITIE